MKKWQLPVVLGVILFAGALTLRAGADSDEEQKLIQVLQSNASPREKDAACARLKFVGTSRCVPALAALLTDEQLSHSARYALEPMIDAQAGRALIDALAKTHALIRVGIINSIGMREEPAATPALVPLLRGTDVSEANAAANALGRIGGTDALRALRAAAQNSTGDRHAAAVDGLMRCANRMLSSNERSAALAAFEQLDAAAEPDQVRIAAFRGRVQASGNAGLNLVLHAIEGPDGPEQLAAVQLVHEIPMQDATLQLTHLLEHLRPAVQVPVIAGLAQRGDPSAVPALIALGPSGGPDVQLAVISALDQLGDASAVSLLASFASSSVASLQKAARQALADIHRGDVTDALLQQLGTAAPPIQAEAARALGSRGDNTAVPKLLELARSSSESARKAALTALSLLADNSHLGALVQLVVQAKDPAARGEAGEAVNAAYQRIQGQKGPTDVAPLTQAIQKAGPDARIVLLPICGGLTDPKIRTTLRAALRDPDPQVSAAAARGLSDTTDPELLGDLLELARSTGQESTRTLAINGAVRLVTQEESVKLPTPERISALKSLLSAAGQTEERRKVLAGLGEVPDMESLRMVEDAVTDKSVCNEAARALIKIVAGLPSNQADSCIAAVNKALRAPTDPGTHQALAASLDQIQQISEYLTSWQVAGPYRQADKDYAALFDIPFPPESQDSKEAKWRSLAPGSDPKRPYVMDLLKPLGGLNCVGYARTWLHSDRDRDALLEFGSDDGIKIWFNDKQVFALNVARPLQPGSDKVKVTLHAGWNPLLLKITQNNQGWEFCMRLRNPDGSHMDGIRCDTAHQTDSAKR
jgi:HEAT repeat protein